MKTQLLTQVIQAISEVMETMFFLTLEPLAHPGPGSDRGSLKTAAVSFSGDFSGTIFLETPPALLATMTENFMGQDIDVLSQEYTEGTLKEALNMIAGNALTQLNKEAYMGLGIPKMVPSPGPEEVDETAVMTDGRHLLFAHVKGN